MRDPFINEIADVDPSAHLPRLSDVARMDLKKRHQALELWVAWFNSHSDKVTPELQRELDRTLASASQVAVDVEQMELMQNSFDRWLKSAGRVGVGKGPNESESPPFDE